MSASTWPSARPARSPSGSGRRSGASREATSTASPHERSGALEAIDRILNRGGDADDVLREVVGALFRLYSYVAISFVEGDGLVLGPCIGVRGSESGGRAFPVSFQGKQVAELYVEVPEAGDDELLTRVATLISAHCLVGWDTGGEPWEP